MLKYSIEVIKRARVLRSKGSTYGEIQKMLEIKVPKSTLFEWFRNVELPADYPQKILNLNIKNIEKAQRVAYAVNRYRRQKFLENITEKNIPIVTKINDIDTAKIALSMLCLGEATKYGSGSPFSLGSSNPKIILIFINLLKMCFDYNQEKIRCTVQCRADQDIPALEQYWMGVTGIPKRLFYKARIDPRTIGKPTKKLNYKGVLKVDYLDTAIQLELESLADLVYNQILAA